MNKKPTLGEIVDTLRNSENGATILIGAGCSVTAGIPLASKFVELIQEKYPGVCEHIEDPTYAKCMGKLAPGQRRALLEGFIADAKLNWCHLAIAQLIKNGHVDRVLTTNFDPLVIRAAALLGEFPAAYDFAASQELDFAYVPEKAIFYLHGLHPGFVLLTTEDECQRHAKSMGQIFARAGEGRTWIVVGYSGDNDPVFDQLAAIKQFGDNLYWIGYKDAEPSKRLREELLTPDKYAFYLNGFDADDFFVSLARRLGCFPPDFVGQPFSYLRQLLLPITPYSFPHEDGETDALEAVRKRIDLAINQYEREAGEAPPAEETPKAALDAQALLLAGEFDRVVAMRPPNDEAIPPTLVDPLAWAYVCRGNALFGLGTTEDGEDADRAWSQATGEYAAALKIKPDMDVALYNWGNTLLEQAKAKTGDVARDALSQACAKYEAALEAKPDKSEALNNWGLALSGRAKATTGTDADALWSEAYVKYAAAIEVAPLEVGPLNNWGKGLSEQAKTKTGEEADDLWSQACAKYAAALEIKPDLHVALNNWGSALAQQANTKTGEEADHLWSRAYGKYAAALEIKPDWAEALNNWGNALTFQAKTKADEAADDLLSEAYAKFAAAFEMMPDTPAALNNWGIALAGQAKIRSGEEADGLWLQACGKHAAALEIKPDDADALNLWGIALSAHARTKEGTAAADLWSEAYGKFGAALEAKPESGATLAYWGNVLLWQAHAQTGEEARRLLAESDEKLLRADAISPGTGTYDLACVRALRSDEGGCLEWLKRSREHGKLPSRAKIDGDSDFDSVRDCDWFKAFLYESFPQDE